MRHWIEELSNREENREAKAKAQLSQLAFARIRKCIEECLEIYNKRHPPPTPSRALEPEIQGNGTLMTIAVRNSPAWARFEFIAGKPVFTRYRRFSDGIEEEDQGEVFIDETGTMQLMFDRNLTPIENVVRGTLQPVLFPAIPITSDDGTLEYYY